MAMSAAEVPVIRTARSAAGSQGPGPKVRRVMVWTTLTVVTSSSGPVGSSESTRENWPEAAQVAPSNWSNTARRMRGTTVDALLAGSLPSRSMVKRMGGSPGSNASSAFSPSMGLTVRDTSTCCSRRLRGSKRLSRTGTRTASKPAAATANAITGTPSTIQR